MPDQVHFFSYATGISIELPAGFTVLSSGPVNESYVRYAGDGDGDSGGDGDGDGDAAPVVEAFVDVRVLADADSAADSASDAYEYDAGFDEAAALEAVTAAVDAMAVHATERRGRKWLEIDGEQVLREEFRYSDGLPGVSGTHDAGPGASGPGAPGHSATGPEGGSPGRAAATDLLRGDITMTFAAVAFGGAVVSVSLVAPWADADAERPIFAAALKSMRCIATEGV